MSETSTYGHATYRSDRRQQFFAPFSSARLRTVSGMSDISERIRRARLAAGFSQAEEAAKRLGMKGAAYRHYESGYRTPPTNRVAEIAKLFKVDLDWLLTGKGDSENDTSQVTTLWGNIPDRDKPAALQMLRALARDQGHTQNGRKSG